MDDKWFIYYEEPHLFLHRSWTGQPVCRVTLRNEPRGAAVTQALWSNESANIFEKQGSDYKARLLDFLLSNLLLGEAKPFPRPPDLVEQGPGALQHNVAGAGYPEILAEPKKPWWRFW
jgi:hypothetical protein